jgi:hypothetical protein
MTRIVTQREASLFGEPITTDTFPNRDRHQKREKTAVTFKKD